MTRLIDADALIDTLNEKNIPVDVRVNYEIMNAPTVEPDGDLISRQAAIYELEHIMGDHPLQGYEDEQLLINALESLPSAEPTGDLISRQAVLSLFPNSFYSGLAKQINALPSAPDSRQRGEWEPLTDYIGNEYFECSKCHDAFYVEFGTPEDNNYNFCPNCGARMNGGEEE